MIGNSELIYNPDGSIYHLNIREEHIAETIFLVGDQNRVPMVSKYFDSIEHKISKREFHTHTGYIGKKRLSVLSTGIGTDNIDIVINELDAIINIDPESRTFKKKKKSLNLIRLGTSGTLNANIKVDSVVASKIAVGMDILMHYYNYEQTDSELKLEEKFQNAFPALHPKAFYCDEALLEQFAPDLYHGITVSAAGFYGPQGRQLRAKNKYPDLLDRLNQIEHNGYNVSNFEMESSGIFGLSRCLNHKALSFNVIIANRATKSFSEDYQKSVDEMIKMVLSKV